MVCTVCGEKEHPKSATSFMGKIGCPPMPIVIPCLLSYLSVHSVSPFTQFEFMDREIDQIPRVVNRHSIPVPDSTKLNHQECYMINMCIRNVLEFHKIRYNGDISSSWKLEILQQFNDLCCMANRLS